MNRVQNSSWYILIYLLHLPSLTLLSNHLNDHNFSLSTMWPKLSISRFHDTIWYLMLLKLWSVWRNFLLILMVIFFKNWLWTHCGGLFLPVRETEYFDSLRDIQQCYTMYINNQVWSGFQINTDFCSSFFDRNCTFYGVAMSYGFIQK
jgi:hypothetical protein